MHVRTHTSEKETVYNFCALKVLGWKNGNTVFTIEFTFYKNVFTIYEFARTFTIEW